MVAPNGYILGNMLSVTLRANDRWPRWTLVFVHILYTQMSASIQRQSLTSQMVSHQKFSILAKLLCFVNIDVFNAKPTKCGHKFRKQSGYILTPPYSKKNIGIKTWFKKTHVPRMIQKKNLTSHIPKKTFFKSNITWLQFFFS